MLPHSDVLSLRWSPIKDYFATPELETAATAYMLISTKRLLAKSSEIDRRLEKLGCSRGGPGFRNRPGGFVLVAWNLKQCQNST